MRIWRPAPWSPATAVWTAGQQPGTRFVPVKTEAQQVVLTLHRL